MSEQRHRALVFKVGEDRFRPPFGLEEVVVIFGNDPINEVFFRRWGAKKAMLLATVMEPKEFHGRTIAGFYALPTNGTLPSGSRLMQDVRTMVGGSLQKDEQVNLQKVFAGRMARVKLKSVGKGADTYAVIDRILGKL